MSWRVSKEKSTDRTAPVWPFITTDSPFADGVHNLTVLSLDAEARKSPSGENCTSVTTPYENNETSGNHKTGHSAQATLPTLCPTNLKALNCGLKFHNMMLLSPEPEASCFKVGLKDKEVT